MMNDCWLAAGQVGISITPTGYANTYFQGSTKRIHRLVFEVHYGYMPPVVMHLCDVPGCYNPRHLRGGTQAENMADMKKKGRSRGPVGEKQHDAVLTEAQVREIRDWFSNSHRLGTQKQLAKKYGVSCSTIGSIKMGKTWKHLA